MIDQLAIKSEKVKDLNNQLENCKEKLVELETLNTKESLKVEVTIQNHDSLLKDFSLLKEENAGLVKLKMAVKDLQDIVKKKDLELVRIAKINDDLKNSEKELKSKIESNE